MLLDIPSSLDVELKEKITSVTVPENMTCETFENKVGYVGSVFHLVVFHADAG